MLTRQGVTNIEAIERTHLPCDNDVGPPIAHDSSSCELLLVVVSLLKFVLALRCKDLSINIDLVSGCCFWCPDRAIWRSEYKEGDLGDQVQISYHSRD